MKKNTILGMRLRQLVLIGALCMLTTSCWKDEDFDFLRNPIHVTGQLDPHYSFPIAYGELNLNDLLTRLAERKEEINSHIDSTSDVLTLIFSGSASDVIYPFSHYHTKTPAPKTFSPKAGGSKSDSWFSIDTVLTAVIPIDLFDHADMQTVVDNDMKITHAYVSLAINALGQYATPTLKDAINQYVTASYGDLSIIYTGRDGTIDTLHSAAIDIPPIEIKDITLGQHDSFDSVDVAPIFNAYPSEVKASFRMTLHVSPDIVDAGIMDVYFIQALDSLHLTSLEYNVNAGLVIPLSLKVPSLPFSYPLSLGDGHRDFHFDSIVKKIHDSLHVDVKDFQFRLAFDNSIPVEFGLEADFLDADSVLVTSLLLNTNTIAAAQVDPNDMPGVAIAPTHTDFIATITDEQLDIINQARILQLRLHLRTANGEHVAIKRDDFLRVKAYIQVQPDISFDIPVVDSGILNRFF